MRISGPGRTSGAQGGAAAKRAGAGGTAFSPVPADTPARAATSTTPMATLSGLDALLALQAFDADRPGGGRRRAVRRGHDLLDVLDELKIGLLSGAMAPAALDRIAGLLGGMEPSGDPELDALMTDIALRAEVEMAKLGRYLDG